MREIKFRGWHGNVMTYGIGVTSQGDWRSNGDTYDGNVFPVMQYTGLKDKNGKEIYEGDVVRCDSGSTKCPHAIEWRTEIGGEFGGGMPGWYLSGLRTGYGKGYAWTGGEEVIGNIYENPELLTH